MIKIDVEGLELQVLKGGKDFFERHRFPPILFEAWGNDWFVNERRELLTYLLSMGYEITSFGTDDYVAQHPQNPVRVDFKTDEQGVIQMAMTHLPAEQLAAI